jgi:hypothetical protein
MTRSPYHQVAASWQAGEAVRTSIIRDCLMGHDVSDSAGNVHLTDCAYGGLHNWLAAFVDHTSVY